MHGGIYIFFFFGYGQKIVAFFVMYKFNKMIHKRGDPGVVIFLERGGKYAWTIPFCHPIFRPIIFFH